jgi:hypothetical protein
VIPPFGIWSINVGFVICKRRPRKRRKFFFF